MRQTIFETSLSDIRSSRSDRVSNSLLCLFVGSIALTLSVTELVFQLSIPYSDSIVVLLFAIGSGLILTGMYSAIIRSSSQTILRAGVVYLTVSGTLVLTTMTTPVDVEIIITYLTVFSGVGVTILIATSKKIR